MGWAPEKVRSEDGYQHQQLVRQGALEYQYEAISVGDVIVAIDDRDTQGKSHTEARVSKLYEE
jgi:C-terminal processing protease CtpA/Prc